MGNAERRFRDSVSKGDEDKANEYYFSQAKKTSKRVIDPNSIVTFSFSSDVSSLTLLQCCALYAMEKLYWEMLRCGGNVRSLTSKGESICHLICTCNHSNVAKKSKIRCKMLSVTIEEFFKNPQSLTSCIDAKDQVIISLCSCSECTYRGGCG